MTRTLEIKRHSVLILSGPSECGKSHFSKHVMSSLKEQGRVCSIISSDDCRRELLGADLHKHDPKMMPVSTLSFNLAYDKLRAYTSYPVNQDVVIFDSTALTRWSRQQIRKIAKENNYTPQVISFDYDDEQEYYKYTDADWLVDIHLKKFRGGKSRKAYKITDRKMPLITFKEESPNCTVKGDMIVIGDVHGCLDQLKALLNKLGVLKNGFIDKAANVVFVGDLVDKGPNSAGVVDFMVANVFGNHCKVVIGNHENYLIKRWAGEISNDNGLEHFDSHSLGNGFEEQLRQIHLRSYSYVRGDNCIVTHSPTELKNLGKDSKSKEMRNFRHSRFTHDELMEKLKEMHEPRNNYMERHIFGHIEFPKPYENKGAVGIDTACVNGGLLTAIKISGSDYDFVSVPGYQKPDNTSL